LNVNIIKAFCFVIDVVVEAEALLADDVEFAFLSTLHMLHNQPLLSAAAGQIKVPLPAPAHGKVINWVSGDVLPWRPRPLQVCATVAVAAAVAAAAAAAAAAAVCNPWQPPQPPVTYVILAALHVTKDNMHLFLEASPPAAEEDSAIAAGLQ
jgi:hypothetical protein